MKKIRPALSKSEGWVSTPCPLAPDARGRVPSRIACSTQMGNQGHRRTYRGDLIAISLRNDRIRRASDYHDGHARKMSAAPIGGWPCKAIPYGRCERFATITILTAHLLHIRGPWHVKAINCESNRQRKKSSHDACTKILYPCLAVARQRPGNHGWYC